MAEERSGQQGSTCVTAPRATHYRAHYSGGTGCASPVVEEPSAQQLLLSLLLHKREARVAASRAPFQGTSVRHAVRLLENYAVSDNVTVVSAIGARRGAGRFPHEDSATEGDHASDFEGQRCPAGNAYSAAAKAALAAVFVPSTSTQNLEGSRRVVHGHPAANSADLSRETAVPEYAAAADDHSSHWRAPPNLLQLSSSRPSQGHALPVSESKNNPNPAALSWTERPLPSDGALSSLALCARRVREETVVGAMRQVLEMLKARALARIFLRTEVENRAGEVQSHDLEAIGHSVSPARGSWACARSQGSSERRLGRGSDAQQPERDDRGFMTATCGPFADVTSSLAASQHESWQVERVHSTAAGEGVGNGAVLVDSDQRTWRAITRGLLVSRPRRGLGLASAAASDPSSAIGDLDSAVLTSNLPVHSFGSIPSARDDDVNPLLDDRSTALPALKSQDTTTSSYSSPTQSSTVAPQSSTSASICAYSPLSNIAQSGSYAWLSAAARTWSQKPSIQKAVSLPWLKTSLKPPQLAPRSHRAYGELESMNEQSSSGMGNEQGSRERKSSSSLNASLQRTESGRLAFDSAGSLRRGEEGSDSALPARVGGSRASQLEAGEDGWQLGAGMSRSDSLANLDGSEKTTKARRHSEDDKLLPVHREPSFASRKTADGSAIASIPPHGGNGSARGGLRREPYGSTGQKSNSAAVGSSKTSYSTSDGASNFNGGQHGRGGTVGKGGGDSVGLEKRGDIAGTASSLSSDVADVTADATESAVLEPGERRKRNGAAVKWVDMNPGNHSVEGDGKAAWRSGSKSKRAAEKRKSGLASEKVSLSKRFIYVRSNGKGAEEEGGRGDGASQDLTEGHKSGDLDTWSVSNGIFERVQVDTATAAKDQVPPSPPSSSPASVVLPSRQKPVTPTSSYNYRTPFSGRLRSQGAVHPIKLPTASSANDSTPRWGASDDDGEARASIMEPLTPLFQDEDASHDKILPTRTALHLATFADVNANARLRYEADAVLADLAGQLDGVDHLGRSVSSSGQSLLGRRYMLGSGTTFDGAAFGYGRGRGAGYNSAEEMEAARLKRMFTATLTAVDDEELRRMFEKEALESYDNLVRRRRVLQTKRNIHSSTLEAFKMDVDSLTSGGNEREGDVNARRLAMEVKRYMKRHRLHPNELLHGHAELGELLRGSADGHPVAAHGYVEKKSVGTQCTPSMLGFLEDEDSDDGSDYGIGSVRLKKRPDDELSELYTQERYLLDSVQLMTIAVVNITRFHRGLEMEVTCMNCLYLFQHPRTLWPCGHTFCQQCLADMYDEMGELVCAVCNTVCDVGVTPNPSVELLTTYQVLHKHLETGGAAVHRGQSIEQVLRALATVFTQM